LLESKNGSLNSAQKNYFSLSFFGLARSNFINKQKAEGHYHLAQAKQYAEHGIPRYKGKNYYGFIYLFSGYIIGFVRLERFLRLFRKKAFKNECDLMIS